MKNKLLTTVLAGVLIAGLGTAAFAGNQPKPIKLNLDGNELATDTAPINVNGKVLVPVRVISEGLGAKVDWDSSTNTVIINSQSTDSQKQQISYLEQALAPKDQLSAVNSWAEGVKTRNGAWQYAVMTPELKKETYNSFAEANWSTGVSSPWVKNYEVKELSKLSDAAYLYSVVFTYTDSTNAVYTENWYITAEKGETSWLVSSIDQVDVKGKITSVTLGDDKKIKSIFVTGSANNGGTYQEANVIIGSNTKIYKGNTNIALTAEDLKEGAAVEATFVEGPMLMIYPPSVEAKVIRVF